MTLRYDLKCPVCGHPLNEYTQTGEYMGVPQESRVRLWCDECLEFRDELLDKEKTNAQ